MVYVLLFIIEVILFSCISVSNHNKEIALNILKNPEKLFVIIKDSNLVTCRGNNSFMNIKNAEINNYIQIIKLFNSEGFELFQDNTGDLRENDIPTGVLLQFIYFKSKSTNSILIFQFDNSENGIWKLDFISHGSPHHK